MSIGKKCGSCSGRGFYVGYPADTGATCVKCGGSGWETRPQCDADRGEDRIREAESAVLAKREPGKWLHDTCHDSTDGRLLHARVVDGACTTIATCVTGRDARVIAHAVNNHDALVSALESALSVANDCQSRWSRGHPDRVAAAEKVLAAAKGGA